LPIFSGIDPGKNIGHTKIVNSVPVAAPPKPVILEPVIPHVEIKKVKIRSAYSTPSIKDALKEDVKPEEAVDKSEIAENEDAKNETANSFSQAELLDAWMNFVSRIEAAQLKSALGTRVPLLNAGWQIEYELDSEVQLNWITIDLKPKLLSYLRGQLRNDTIEIQFKVSDGTDNKSHKPYTDAEKWSSLVEKYPALAELKSKFGLDFEHF